MTTKPLIPDTPTADALASVHDAGMVKVPPWMSIVAALASAQPDGVGATIDWLVEHRAELERAYVEGQLASIAPAALPASMHYQTELGYLDRPRNDHVVRDRYLFADIVGKQSFYQSAVFAMTGHEITARDAAMLDEFGQANLLIDRRVWPLAVTRRVGARSRNYTAAVLGGTAMLGATVLAGAAAADCARFLRRARGHQLEGRSPADSVADVLARGERVMGFGRPVVGPDERVPIIKDILARYGRDELPYVKLLGEVDDAFAAQKNLRSTAAAWAAAILSDFGMNPDAVQAVSNYWVAVNIYSMALYSVERGLVSER